MELKPCPFCNGEVDYNERGKVQCTGACIAIDAEGYANEWNHRPIEDALRARVAELEAFVEAVRETNYAAITGEQYSLMIYSALAALDAAKKGE